MKFVPDVITKSVVKQIGAAKRQSPHIFFAAGVIGVVGGTVLACKATLKLGKVVDEFQDDIDRVNSQPEGNQTDREHYQDVVRVYAKGTYNIAKLYAPAATVGVISIGALTGSHIQLTRRNAVLTATLTTITKAFDEYRARVRAELGEEKETDIYKSVMRQVSNPETRDTVERALTDPNALSVYAKVFDEYNENWQRTPEYNRVFLQVKQTYLNDLLHARGHVFLNEVYRELGFDHTKAGAIVGWRLSPEGDNFIDFSIFHDRNSDFVNGYERSIWLDFNVDGVIFDKIEKSDL